MVLRCLLQIGIMILKTRLVTRLPLNVHMSVLKCFTVSDFVSSVYTVQLPIELLTIIYRMKLLVSSYVYAGFPDNNNNTMTPQSPP